MKERIPQLALIFAKDQNNVLGKGNTLPWRSPHDLRWFQTQTIGYSVIMGRKTWESLPSKQRPLFNRTNYVITSNSDYVAEGARVMASLQDAIDDARRKNKHGMIFVIGGKALLEEASHVASKAYVSHIGVQTPVDETCVMAPTLPVGEIVQTIPLFAGDDSHPSVELQEISFV